jgi:30S ribosome assembly GTPase
VVAGAQLASAQKRQQEPVCDRCHRLINYQEAPATATVPTMAAVRAQLSPLSRERCLLVVLVDLFDFEGSFVPYLSKVTGVKPAIVVGNKVDLLPLAHNEPARRRVRAWLRRRVSEEAEGGLEYVRRVHLVSSKSGEGVKAVVDDILALANGMNVYVVGTTNVGKSSFLNHVRGLLQDRRVGVRAITTSPIPGTTLDFIPMALPDNAGRWWWECEGGLPAVRGRRRSCGGGEK